MNNATKRARFRAMHEQGCFLIPNPWDVGSAKRLERMGFEALASTSAGAAWALGKEDGQLTLQEVLQHLSTLCDSTALPVNADFESGFAETAEGLSQNVALAIHTGVAGLSIEDYKRPALFEVAEAVERISAAREAIDNSGEDVLLVARSEGFLRSTPDLRDTILRLIAYRDAGADCLYAPGVKDLSFIREIVDALAPSPINVLLFGPELRASDLARIGVRRISVGGALARIAWSAFQEAAEIFQTQGILPTR